MDPRAYRVSFHAGADADLAEIRGYTFAVSGLDHASRKFYAIAGRAEGLQSFPHRHEQIPLLPGDARVIRRLPVLKHYLIVYRVDDDIAEVTILGVFATRRHPRHLDDIVARQ